MPRSIPTRATRRLWTACGVGLALLVLGTAFTSMVPVPTAAQAETGSIIIDGDEAVCQGNGHGIINCATADGSPEDPYVISGHTITIADSIACEGGQGQPIAHDTLQCSTPPSCNGAPPAAISVCNVTYSIIIRDVHVEISERPSVVGLLLRHNTDVRVQNTQLSAAGEALRIEGPERGPAGVILSNSRINSTLAVGADPAPGAEEASLVFVADTEFTVESTHINATGHPIGMNVLNEGERFTMSTSRIEGALRKGLQVDGAAITITDNEFLRNGMEAAAVSVTDPVATGAIWLGHASTSAVFLEVGELPYRFVNNSVQIRGVGLYVGGNGPGIVEWNQFFADAPEDVTRPIAVRFNNDSCKTRFWYNDLEPRTRIQHSPGLAECPLDARFVWWGNQSGPNLTSAVYPQIEGSALYFPHLNVSTEDLPKVVIESPAPGTRAISRVTLAGTAHAPVYDLTHVEATADGNWSNARTAVGTSEWTLEWDLAGQSLGLVRLEVRGCAAHCGAIAWVDIVHIEAPKPPVAVLQGSPRVLYAGDIAQLDGSASFAADGAKIVEYRFNFGDRRETGWQGSPIAHVQYNQSGTYVASLEVRDDAGNVNHNSATIVLRVRAAGDPIALAETPGPGALVLLLGGAVAAWATARSVVRRP